jgi:hypothetical protein
MSPSNQKSEDPNVGKVVEPVSTPKKKNWALHKIFLFTAKIIVSIFFLYQGISKLRPVLNPDLYFKIDQAYRGEYGRIIQNFITLNMKSKHSIQLVRLKRSIGIYICVYAFISYTYIYMYIRIHILFKWST